MDDSFEECEIARGRRVPLPRACHRSSPPASRFNLFIPCAAPAIRLTAVGISFPENSHFAVVVSNGASLAAVNACLCKADAGRVVSWVAEHCADRGLPFCKLLPEMFGDLQAHQRGDRPRVSSAQVDTLVVRDGQVMALSGLDELDCARDSADLAPIGRSLLCHECDALLERNHGHVLQAFARNLSRLNDWAAEVFAFHPDAEVPSHARARRDNVARMSSPCAALAFRCYAYGHPHLMDPHCERCAPLKLKVARTRVSAQPRARRLRNPP